jgi:hypothetical protein
VSLVRSGLKLSRETGASEQCRRCLCGCPRPTEDRCSHCGSLRIQIVLEPERLIQAKPSHARVAVSWKPARGRLNRDCRRERGRASEGVSGAKGRPEPRRREGRLALNELMVHALVCSIMERAKGSVPLWGQILRVRQPACKLHSTYRYF